MAVDKGENPKGPAVEPLSLALPPHFFPKPKMPSIEPLISVG